MGVAAPRAPIGGWGPGPPQKFGHRSLFVGQLLSRNQVSQKNQGEPPLSQSADHSNVCHMLMKEFNIADMHEGIHIL